MKQKSEKNILKKTRSGRRGTVSDMKKIKIPKEKKLSKWMILTITGVVTLLIGAGCLVASFLTPKRQLGAINFPTIPSRSENDTTYSELTGEPLADSSLKDAPTFCIQIPNGTDGARPQAGLTQAGVIYEAIAEAGITRFDAVFQNPTSAVIGPIRSLRVYYLDFAAPFGCTVVHAGGPGDAISALHSGGYRDLDESYTYMFRSQIGNRLWNNLFTTANNLKKFNSDNGYNSSEIKGFSRMTPEESLKSRADNLAANKLSITSASSGNTSEMAPKVGEINLSFESTASFNVHYSYKAETNTYERSYQSGNAHEVYECPNEDLGEQSPENVCKLATVAPSVVIAMVVPERRAADNYHEDIDMIGSGSAYIFQNGMAIEASWSKSSRNDQIHFSTKEGHEIKLAPGQVFISAIPNYGSVEY